MIKKRLINKFQKIVRKLIRSSPLIVYLVWPIVFSRQPPSATNKG